MKRDAREAGSGLVAGIQGETGRRMSEEKDESERAREGGLGRGRSDVESDLSQRQHQTVWGERDTERLTFSPSS